MEVGLFERESEADDADALAHGTNNAGFRDVDACSDDTDCDAPDKLIFYPEKSHSGESFDQEKTGEADSEVVFVFDVVEAISKPIRRY